MTKHDAPATLLFSTLARVFLSMSASADDTDPLAPAMAALDALAKRSTTPSKAAAIARLLPKIEAAQAAGASNGEIVAELNRSGLTISLRTFETTLSRVRHRLRAAPDAATTANNNAQAPKKTEQKPQRRIRTGLQMPDPPPAFHWDPLERPNITFIDDEDSKED